MMYNSTPAYECKSKISRRYPGSVITPLAPIAEGLCLIHYKLPFTTTINYRTKGIRFAEEAWDSVVLSKGKFGLFFFCTSLSVLSSGTDGWFWGSRIAWNTPSLRIIIGLSLRVGFFVVVVITKNDSEWGCNRVLLACTLVANN
jgi:hypothetical protein